MKSPSLRDLVDAELPLSEDELLKISHVVQRRRGHRWQDQVRFLTIFFLPAFVLLGVGAVLSNYFGHRQLIIGVAGLLMIVWWCSCGRFFWRQSWHVTGFRSELNRRGFRVCIQCGYWLKGLGPKIENCPECGHASPLQLAEEVIVDDSTLASDGRSIDRADLLARLKRADTLKRNLTLSTVLVYGVLWFTLASPWEDPVIFLIGMPVVGVLANLAVRFTICARLCRCPHCGASLWRCASRAGKGGAITIDQLSDRCPKCAAPFV